MSAKKRNKNKRKVRTVVALSIISLLFISTGYAAISTNITLNAKGNIIKQSSDLSTEDLTKAENVLDSSSTKDGLYKDTTEEAVNGKYRYIYRGANPDNYICLSDEETCDEESMYRIIAIETDGTLKVIKNKDIGTDYWDTEDCSVAYNLKKSTKKGSTYEIDNIIYLAPDNTYGCNNWTRPSEINTRLNSTWYSDLSNGLNSIAKSKIETNHIFYIGAVSYTSGQTLDVDVAQEKAKTWNGAIGLMGITDYVKASTNPNCTSLYSYGYQGDSSCYNNSPTHNFLSFNSSGSWTSGSWTISPDASDSYSVWNTKARFESDDRVGSEYAGDFATDIHPVFFLSSDIKLSGEGTSTNPYRIS